LLNITDGAGLSANGERWNDYLPEFVKNEVMSTGFWDGVFYDNIWTSISWYNNGNIDLNNDGILESKSVTEKAWSDGVKKMLAKTQSLLSGYLVTANSQHDVGYQPYLNGIMLENFPSSWEADGTWAGSMKSYLDNKNFISPYVGLINSNTDNTWAPDNYRKLRLSFCSALLGDGNFSFDFGPNDHSQTWWYDEYQAVLGKAAAEPINILDKKNKTFKKGLWRRDFENGIVVVNSTAQTQNYAFTDESFTKLSGAQDPNINNGSRVNLVSIAANDAVILMGNLADRKIPATNATSPTALPPLIISATSSAPAVPSGQTSSNYILKAVFKNGAFYRVFDATGNQTQNGFFAYTANFPGGSQIISVDIDNDGVSETLVNYKGTITIYHGTKILKSFQPFDGKFSGDISLAVADLNGNGQKQLVIGAGKGGGPQIRIFSVDCRLLSGGFFAYDRNFRGGVNVAAIDYNNDGKDEIIAGAGMGGGPQVRIFNRDGKVLGGWFAYDKNSRSGVTVAAGKFNVGSEKQIITGTGPGVAPQVRVWDKFGKLISQFLAYDKTSLGGITVSATDINNDGKDEILAGSLNY
jgi:hypothetical protein